MNTGIGFSEFILVVILILIFFGSKELPGFIKKAAQLLATVRRYSNRIKGELTNISNSIDLQPDDTENEQVEKKNALRNRYRTLRKAVTTEMYREKSDRIHALFKSTEEYKSADVIMIYHHVGSEVPTTGLINEMLSDGKRIILPYCKMPTYELGIAEIKDLESDCAPGEFKIPEPIPSLRGKFLRSDIHLIVCPGVAFDKYGGRLGNGKGCYDRFCNELKGKIPIFAFAFDCQITSDTLPFDYHDIPMDQIITESGLLLPYGSNQEQHSDSMKAAS